jgi:hypothetical protein
MIDKTSDPAATRRDQRRGTFVKLTLFRKNALPAQLILLSIVFELMFAVRVLDVMKIDYLMGISTFADILLLFLLFTCSVKVGVYSRFWTWMTLALALFALLRAVVLVPFVLKPIDDQVWLQLWNAGLFLCLAVAGLRSLVVSHRRQALMETSEGKALLSKAED